MSYKFKFGDEVTDKITGFVGIVTGAVSYMTGCDQMLVQPTIKEDGSYKEALWFDDGRLKKLRKKITKKSIESKTGNGACGIAPVK